MPDPIGWIILGLLLGIGIGLMIREGLLASAVDVARDDADDAREDAYQARRALQLARTDPLTGSTWGRNPRTPRRRGWRPDATRRIRALIALNATHDKGERDARSQVVAA